MKKFIINTDGGSRNNPGPAAAGFIIKDEQGNILFKEGVYLGVATNNVAEYMAVKFALEKLLTAYTNKLPANVEVRADSLLIISQLQGKYKMKNPRLKVIFNEIKALESCIRNLNYTYIPRGENSAADKLVNDTLDKN